MSGHLRNRRTIHIDIPIEASFEDVEAFENALTAFVFKKKWRKVDPFIHSHAQACEDSDHCAGPGSLVEREILARHAKGE